MNKLATDACVFAFHGQQHTPSLQVRKILSQINKLFSQLFHKNILLIIKDLGIFDAKSKNNNRQECKKMRDSKCQRKKPLAGPGRNRG